MIVNYLILEVTRRCNMCCAHCLRGNSQDVDMSRQVVDRVLQDIDEIKDVFFTGGEPSLNIPIMEYFFEQAQQKHICVGSFGLVTNGKEKQEELVRFIKEHLSNVKEKNRCFIGMSRDQFHEPVSSNLFRQFPFYSNEKERPNREKKTLLSEGRAEGWSGTRAPSRVGDKLWVMKYRGETVVHNELSVSANGNILGCCDLSYKHEDGRAIGNF